MLRKMLRISIGRLTGFLLILSILVVVHTAEGAEGAKSDLTGQLVSNLQKLIESDAIPSGPFSANIIAAEQKSATILLLKPGSDWNKPESVIWRWVPSESPEIAKDHVSWFGHPSECKPVYGTSHLLTVASGGGVALVRFSDKKVLFYAMPGGNPHSAAILPDGNIITASSTGNYLKLFVVPSNFTGPNNVVCKTIPFEDAHGLVWDNARQILWALGGNTLAGFYYRGEKENPSLEKFFNLTLPDELKGGHDLYSIAEHDYLFVTGNQGVGLFDPQTRQVSVIAKVPGIKSLSLLPGGTLLVLQPREKWWAESLFYLNRQLTPAGTLAKARFYKARWWIPDKLDEGMCPVTVHGDVKTQISESEAN